METTCFKGDKGNNKTVAINTHNVVGIQHRELFDYIESILNLFAETGNEFDVVRTYEIEKMYMNNDYTNGTDEHKELLISVLDIAQMTHECFGKYGDIVDGISYMIKQI